MLMPIVIGVVAAVAVGVALAHRWELPRTRVALTVGALGSLCGLVVGLLDLKGARGPFFAAAATFVGALAASAGAGLWLFFRDPGRSPPDRDDVVVSPADGKVIYVRKVEAGVLPVLTKSGRKYTIEELTKTTLRDDPVVVIGIALNYLDVHVNRAPVAGSVVEATHFPGRFASLKRPEAVFENERATLLLRRGDLEVAIVLIASRLVRRIVIYVKAGEHVALGQRIGAIRFGSQADIILPLDKSTRILVRVGDRVRAGETVVASIVGGTSR